MPIGHKTGAVLLVMTIIVAVAAIYVTQDLFHDSQPEILTQTDTSTATFIKPITETVTTSDAVIMLPDEAQSTNQTTGLMFEIALNSSLIVETGNDSTSILVVVSEYNFRNAINNLTSENDWRIDGLTLGQCRSGPFGIAVFPGYYSLTNISNAPSALSLNGPTWCPVQSIQTLSSFYAFLPQSSVAIVRAGTGYQYDYSGNHTTTITELTTAPEPIINTITFNGYCCRTITNYQNCSCIFNAITPFQAGTYTVAGGDQWGDLVLTHFSVMSGNSSQIESGTGPAA